jgi:phospholipid-binding lipoprotein MlaA
MNKFLLTIIFLSSFNLSGCSSSNIKEIDPFEQVNRKVLAFNKDIDSILFKPVATVYNYVMPNFVRRRVTNFFSNLDDIKVVANDILQLKFKQATSDSGRFVVNSTLGIVGLFDIATRLNMPKHYEDFGQTLGYWGIGSGPYLVLPILGASSLRDAIGSTVDFNLDPLLYLDEDSYAGITYALSGLKIINTRADLFGAEKILETATLDPYSFIRDSYLQQREALVYDGELPNETISDEELFDDE